MRLAAVFLLALAITACQSPEEQMEDSVRNLLSDRGNVQEAELTEGADGNMTGHAVVAAAGGQSSRYTCSANKTGEGTRYNINCVPSIDEPMLQAIEADIRRTYEQRGAEVVEVDMQRHNDDNHMRGFIRGRDTTGDVRLACTAERDTANNQFPWVCNPENTAASAEPGASGEEAAAEGEGGK